MDCNKFEFGFANRHEAIAGLKKAKKQKHKRARRSVPKKGTMRSSSQIKNYRRGNWLLAFLCAAAITFSATTGWAGDSRVLQVNSTRYYGKTYNEWVVAYWQWAMSIPIATNPWFNDSTGAFAGIGQSGPVWFLGGTAGDSVTRDITIPSGKALFLPVHPWIFGAMVFDCDPSNPGVTCDVQSLKKSAAAAAKAATELNVSIDGKAVQDVKDYRVVSAPLGFYVTVPDDNIATFLGTAVPAGTYGPHVADGYYMLLAPLAPGAHTITVHVVSSLGFEYVNTYNLTVSP